MDKPSAVDLLHAWADAAADCNQNGDHDLKIKGCTEIISKGHETKDNLAIVYYNRGWAYGTNGDYDRAIADFNKAVELDPKYAHPYKDRGNAYQKKGNYDQAIADEDKAIELDPKYAQAYSIRGSAYTSKGDYDRGDRRRGQGDQARPEICVRLRQPRLGLHQGPQGGAGFARC